MSTRHCIGALRPHLRMVGFPLACFVLGSVAWVAAGLVTAPAIEHTPSVAGFIPHLLAGMGVTATAGWLSLRFRRAVTQGHRDEVAADLLDALRRDAAQPGTILLEIDDVQWTAHSGQRVWAVDVLTGEVSDRWIPGQLNPPGSLVLLRHAAGYPPEVLAGMTPEVMAAANRHRANVVCSKRSPGRMVVEAAVSLLRER